MSLSVYELKEFYATKEGRIIRRILTRTIRSMWAGTSGLRVLGLGYGGPYLSQLCRRRDTERVIAMMSAGIGVINWPAGGANATALCEDTEMPLESESVDRILMVHGLEYAELARSYLAEIWRVLHSDGRLVLVVANRASLWSQREWSPFGQGRPYSYAQLTKLLRDSGFTIERSQAALYVPPWKILTLLRAESLFRMVGQWIFPLFAGVHVIEVSKRVYAPIPKKGLQIRGKRILVPTPKPANVRNSLKTR